MKASGRPFTKIGETLMITGRIAKNFPEYGLMLVKADERFAELE